MAMEERKASDYLKLPEISAEDFGKHMAEDDFLLRYGNPVVIHRDDYRDLLCIAWEYYERLCRQIDALESELDALHEDANIKTNASIVSGVGHYDGGLVSILDIEAVVSEKKEEEKASNAS